MTFTRIVKSIASFLPVVVLLLTLSACRESAQPTPTPNPDVQINVDYGDTPTVGDTALTVSITNATGAPRGDVIRVAVRGDMTHAGMVPVLAETATADSDGVFTLPFTWTMRGDWILTIEITLTDQTNIRQDFRLNVTE